MEHQKILHLLNDANDSKFVTSKWNIFSDNSKLYFDVANEVTYNTEVLKSNPCNYNDAYILVKDEIIVTAGPATQASYKKLCTFY